LGGSKEKEMELKLVSAPTKEEFKSWFDNPTMVCGVCNKELPLEDFACKHAQEGIGIICCPCFNHI